MFSSKQELLWCRGYRIRGSLLIGFFLGKFPKVGVENNIVNLPTWGLATCPPIHSEGLLGILDCGDVEKKEGICVGSKGAWGFWELMEVGGGG
jgi:hypothetical protein